MALRVDQWPLIQQLLSLPILYLLQIKESFIRKDKKKKKKKARNF
jgi:hypothetical protein